MNRLASALLVVLPACGRIGFYELPRTDASPTDVPATIDASREDAFDSSVHATETGLPGARMDAAIDASRVDASPFDASPTGTNTPDGGPIGGACNWASGPPAFGPARSVGMPNTPAAEFDPTLSHDGLSLYFISLRTSSNDVFVSTRASIAASFGPGNLLNDASTPANETHFFTGPDELECFVASDRSGTLGMADIFRATRATAGARWGTFTDLAAVNSADGDFDPHLQSDALTLWLSPIGRAGGAGMQDLFLARRPDRFSPFGTPVAAGALNSSANEWNDSLTDDGTVIVFSSDRSGSPHVYYATRRSRADSFGAPQRARAVRHDIVGSIRNAGRMHGLFRCDAAGRRRRKRPLFDRSNAVTCATPSSRYVMRKGTGHAARTHSDETGSSSARRTRRSSSSRT